MRAFFLGSSLHTGRRGVVRRREKIEGRPARVTRVAHTRWMTLPLLHLLALTSSIALYPARLDAQRSISPHQARDRGPGIATSMFGIYVDKGELLVYPYFEYYRDGNAEYSPAELGYGPDREFFGRYRASEGLLFLGYGLTDRIAIEMEAAVITATLDRAPDDNTGTPRRVTESGLGDVEGQIRYRWQREGTRAPELFSFLEVVAPFQRNKRLIGTQAWEQKLGLGAIKSFAFGTLTVRAAAERPAGESKIELGEYAIEYLRRLSPSWRIYTGVEGTQDEVELITEAQWQLRRGVLLKLNNAIGITSKATDWAPEIGVMFSFPGARRGQ